ncbi:MAG TPA: thioredoxin domain-containing protein [Bryobacteraceae bacterium]|jgi:protein-disulfide isomerase
MKPLFALAIAAASTLSAYAAEAPAHVMGAPNAPITIELFSDFQCPGCKFLHETTIKELRQSYVSSGKVRLVYRDIHLPMHRYARIAGTYADAAEKLGLYDTVADRLFATQAQWEQTGDVDKAVSAVVPPPQMLKLRAMAADPSVGRALDEETQQALEQIRIPGTPTLIIHHGTQSERIGQVSMPILSKYLDTLLAGK